MPAPTGYNRKIFGSQNGFNPYAGGRVPPGQDAGMQGFCFAMTCRWIKLSIQHGIEGASRVMDGRELLHISIVQSGYLSLFPTGKTGAKNSTQGEKLVYDQAGLRKIWLKDYQDAMDAIDHANESGIQYFEVQLPEHSVGLGYDNANETIYYFDPNYVMFEYDDHDDIIVHWRAENYLNRSAEYFAVDLVLLKSK